MIFIIYTACISIFTVHLNWYILIACCDDCCVSDGLNVVDRDENDEENKYDDHPLTLGNSSHIKLFTFAPDDSSWLPFVYLRRRMWR